MKPEKTYYLNFIDASDTSVKIKFKNTEDSSRENKKSICEYSSLRQIIPGFVGHARASLQLRSVY